MIKQKFYLLSLTILLLSACSWFTSDYQLPKINVPLAMQGREDSAANSAKLPYLAWWRQFNDSTLNTLIESSLENNTTIAMAVANIQIAKTQLETIKLNWIPGVSVFAGLSQNPALGSPGVFYGLEPTYFMNFFNNYYLQQQAKLNVDVSYAQKMAVRLTVITQVAASYFSLLAWQNNLTLLKQREDIYKRMLHITQVLKQNDLASELSITNLQSELHQVQSQERVIANNIVISQNALSYLINQPPSGDNILDDYSDNPKSFNDLDSLVVNIGSINAQVVANRPDVMVATKQIKAAGRGINVAASNLIPSLQLDSFNGQSQIGTGATGVSNFNDAYALFNLNPSIFGNVSVNQAKLKLAIANYNDIIQNALRQISNTLSANSKLNASYKLNAQAEHDMQNNYKIQQENFNNGITSRLDLLNTELKVNDLQLQVNNSKLQQLISVVLLYQQLAGGCRAS